MRCEAPGDSPTGRGIEHQAVLADFLGIPDADLVPAPVQQCHSSSRSETLGARRIEQLDGLRRRIFQWYPADRCRARETLAQAVPEPSSQRRCDRAAELPEDAASNARGALGVRLVTSETSPDDSRCKYGPVSVCASASTTAASRGLARDRRKRWLHVVAHQD